MSQGDIVITVNDYVNKTSVSYQVHNISNDMKIKDILERIKSQKNYSYPVSSLVVYFARVECNHDERLSTYNKSNRKMIKLELYLANMITVNVKTMHSCGSGNTRCIPLWAFCCKQTIRVTLLDTSEVRVLKQKIFDMTDEDSAIPVDNIVLIYKGAPLNNFLTLKESELVNNCNVTYFVPLCYIYKEKKKQGDSNEKDEHNDEYENMETVTHKKSSISKKESTIRKTSTVAK